MQELDLCVCEWKQCSQLGSHQWSIVGPCHRQRARGLVWTASERTGVDQLIDIHKCHSIVSHNVTNVWSLQNSMDRAFIIVYIAQNTPTKTLPVCSSFTISCSIEFMDFRSIGTSQKSHVTIMTYILDVRDVAV